MNTNPDFKSDPLFQWGWTNEWAKTFDAAIATLNTPIVECSPARILAEQRDYFTIVSRTGIQRAESKGRLRKKAELQPAVGDWVVLDRDSQIEWVLPRATCLRRKAAGENADIQIMACNIDWIFVTTSLNRDFNLRRLERFFVAAKDSRARTALVVTKIDLAPSETEVEKLQSEVTTRFGPDTKVIYTSAMTLSGLDSLRQMLKPHLTGVFLGTSGVGKSSLVNCLLNENTQAVGEIRGGDEKGRHTTTGRNSYLVPSGGVIIDSPGIRELQLADGEIRIEDEFSDIEELALGCKFTNCQHENEKGCAIRIALDQQSLSADRLLSYRKLKQEIVSKSGRKSRR